MLGGRATVRDLMLQIGVLSSVLPHRQFALLFRFTQPLPQELRLGTGILLEVWPCVAIKMATRNDVQLLRLASALVSLESEVCRCQDVILSDGHEQRRRGEAVDQAGSVVVSQALNTVNGVSCG